MFRRRRRSRDAIVFADSRAHALQRSGKKQQIEVASTSVREGGGEHEKES